MSYISFPVEVDYEDVYSDAVTFLQNKFAGWDDNAGNLDTAILQAWATEAAQLRELAGSVTQAIFRWFGASLMNLPPIDAAPATTLTTWTMVDNGGYTVPAETQVIISQDGNDYAFETLTDFIVPPGSTVAANIPIVAIIAGAAASNIGAIGAAVQLYDALSFVSGITMAGPTADGLDAEDDATYLTRLREELTLMSPRLILPQDFAIDAKQTPGVWRAVALDGYNPFHNLLNLNDASFETSVAGWVAALNCTIAQSAAQALDGTKSMALTAIAAADMSASLSLADQIAVTPGDTITAIAFYRANATSRNVKTGISWYDNTNTIIGATVYGAIVADLSTGWTEAFVTAVAPSNATHCRVVVYVVGPAAGGIHYVDEVSIRRGSTTDWVPGGTGETGQPRTISEANVDVNGNPVDAGTKAVTLARQQALREVNFIINMIDANQVAIDVTFTVVARSGVDHAQLLIDTEAAVSAFLDPAAWAVDKTVQGDAQSRTWVLDKWVRYLALANVLLNTQGVASISLLQLALHSGAMGTADVSLPGPAPLATAGTIIGAVS